MQVEGQNAYQFCIQPPGAPAFVGNSVCLLCSCLFLFLFFKISTARFCFFPLLFSEKKMDVATMLYSFFLLLTNVNFMQTF
jgi:hypothetical protein